MHTLPQIPTPDEIRTLAAMVHQTGYATAAEWYPSRSTLEIAELVGSVVRLESVLPGRGIPTVQALRPRRATDASTNRYSGHYGLDAFPPHTDLAHWSVPPHYLLLRCEGGASDVATVLIPAATLGAIAGHRMFSGALLRPRGPRATEPMCLLPLRFFADGIHGLRWDSLFVLPANKAAQRFAAMVQHPAWIAAHTKQVTLAKPGDTLVLDNWRCLHGRSSVGVTDTHRLIERVYLSKL